MRLEAAVWASFLSTTALCSHGLDFAHRHLHLRADHAHEHLKRDASRTVNALVRRDDVFNAPGGIWPTVSVPAGFTLAAGVEITPIPGMSISVQSGGASATITGNGPAATAVPVGNSAQWDAAASAACMSAVAKLNGQANNPAGIAVCYNVPYLDERQGIFEAELRMYNISPPTAPFVGVTPDTMMVTLQYAGATIQKSDGTLPVKRSLEERQAATSSIVATTNGIMAPIAIAIKKYIGQVNSTLMSPSMNLTQFQPLLIPQITISAKSPATQQLVNTSVSTSQASFVAGVFSTDAGNQTDPKSLLGKPAEQIAAAAAGIPTPFDVPGLSLGVFPVGLIVTSAWTLLFFMAVGSGTVARIQWRDEYRRAVRQQKVDNVRRL